MVANVDMRKITGVGGEAEHIQTALFDSEGKRRKWSDVIDEIGDMQAILALVEMHLLEGLNTPKTRGYPPRVFVSYRRTDTETIQWVGRLATAIEARGYRVDVDENAIGKERPSPDELAEYIGRMALADIFLVVLCEEYLPAENGMRAWLWEEWSRLARMRNWGVAEVLTVLRSGDLEDAPAPIIRVSGTLDALVDVRDHPDDITLVVQMFPPYTGLKLTDPESRQLATSASAVIAAARASRWNDCDQAYHALKAIPFANGTEEYCLAAVWHASFFEKEAEKRWGALKRFGACGPGIPSTSSAATALWLADYNLAAIRLFAPISEAPSLWRGEAHHVMGEYFRGTEEWLAARNHLHFAAQLMDEQTPGLELANENKYLAADIMEELGNSGLDIALECPHCEARFHNQPICVLCGAQDMTANDGDCRSCGYPILELAEVSFCVICRRGLPGSESEGMNAHLVLREVGGTYSVLAPVGTMGIEQLMKFPNQ